MTRPSLAWFDVRFPRELDEPAVIAALSVLSGLSRHHRLVFDLCASEHELTHRLGITADAAEILTASLRAAMPSAQLTVLEAAPTRPTGQRVLWQLTPRVAPLRIDSLGALAAGLLSSLYPLGGEEHIVLRWQVRPSARPPLQTTPDEQRTGRTLAIKHKLEKPGLAAHGELFVHAARPGRRHQLLMRASVLLRSLSTPHGRLHADPYWWGQLLHVFGFRGRFLSVSELAAVIGWPIDAPDIPGLELGASRRLVASRSLPRTGRVLGISDASGSERPVAITPKASTRGLYILGPTGTGKSSLIKNLIADDLKAGHGLAVVETNGDLIKELCDLIPPERVKDVILLDATDPTHAVGFNPFAGTSDPALAADQIGELFQRLWSSFWGPRTGQLAHMGLLTLARRPGATLLDLPRLFLDPVFRAAVLADLDDPIGLGPDWQWFAQLPEREAATVIAPLLNKVRQFTARASIRAIIGQSEPALSMRSMLAEQKVLLVHIPKGLIGQETSQLLGCLVLTALWQAAAERAGLAQEARRPFGLYVDEVQDFASAPLPWEEMFAQGRKYGLALTVAHQNLAQLPKELREVILANARSKVAFTLSASDAKSLEPLFAPALTASDLQALDAFAIAALVGLDNGATARPVTLQTPPPPDFLGSAEAVRHSSRELYAKPRDEIEAALRARVEPKPPTGLAVGRKLRTRS